MTSFLDNGPGGPTPRAASRRTRRGAAAELPVATISEFDGVRYLHLGDTPWVQGAMRLHRPRKLELEYVQRMMVWLLLHEPEAWKDLRAVQLGMGAASLVRYCHGELGMHTTAVEINEQVVAACRQWFRLPADDERLRVVLADAGAWVAEPAHRAGADVLCVDLYDHEAAAPVLDDEAFYRHCHELLDDSGAMTVNLFGRRSSFARSAQRIAAAFVPAGGQVWQLAPTAEGNTIVLALKTSALPERQTLERRAEQVAARCGLKTARWVPQLQPVPLAAPRPAKATVQGAPTP